MSEINIIGCMDNTKDHTFESANRVYGVDGICPTLPTCSGGGIQPKVIEVIKLGRRSNVEEITDVSCLRMVRTEEGKALRKDYEAGRIHHGFNEHREAEPRTDGVCNTLTTVPKDNYLLEVKQATKRGYVECEIGGVADLNYPDSKTRRGRVIRNGTVCPTLMTGSIPNVLEKFVYEIDGETYLIRIRKLTPLECWRLMGFTDEDFNKAASVNSNTQLYKQAGNSIVKQVLMAVFSQMLTPETQIDNLKRKALSILELL